MFRPTSGLDELYVLLGGNSEQLRLIAVVPVSMPGLPVPPAPPGVHLQSLVFLCEASRILGTLRVTSFVALDCNGMIFATSDEANAF